MLRFLKKITVKAIISLVALTSFCSLALDLFEVKNIESLQEKKLGNEFLQIIWDSGAVIDDIEMQTYLRKIGFELVAYSKNPGKHFDFFLLDDNSINAFAGSYGYIGVYSGMILASDLEAELAAVLAHEISHITQNHLKRFSEKVSTHKYLVAAGLIAAALIGNSDVSNAVATSAVAYTAQKNINFTREHEWEADRVGTEMLKKTGYDPRGMAYFFEKLKDNPGAQEFLRSHPLSINRIADNIQRSARHKGKYKDDSFEYLTIKAKLYYANKKEIKLEENKEVMLYMNAYKAFEDTDYKTAKKYIDKLLKTNTTKPSYILAGRIMSKLGNVELAQQYFNKSLTDEKDEASIYYLTQFYSENNKLDSAIKILKQFLRTNTATMKSHKLLASFYVAKGELDRAHIQSAKALIMQGKLAHAIGHYKHAKSITQSQDLYDMLIAMIDNLQKEVELYKEL